MKIINIRNHVEAALIIVSAILLIGSFSYAYEAPMPEKMEKLLSEKYKGKSIKYPHVVDVLVAGRLIVEVKATEQYDTIFVVQEYKDRFHRIRFFERF